MAWIIPRDKISLQYAKIIQSHLTLKPKPSFQNKNNFTLIPPIIFFDANTERVILPYFYGRKIGSAIKYSPETHTEFPIKQFEFNQKLYANQEEVIIEAMQQLETYKTTTLNLYTGFGKTER